MHKLTTSMFASLRYRRRQRRQAATWKEIVRHNFLQKGKIPLLLAVEAGNQSMCRELLSSQTADQLKVSWQVIGDQRVCVSLESMKK